MLPPVNRRRLKTRSTRLGTSPLARSAVFVAATAACLLSLAVVAVAEPASVPLPGKTDGWTQVIKGGFTDPNNSMIASYVEYKGYLYASTTANDFSTQYSGSDKMGGDILRTKDGITWEQMGVPGLGDTDNTSFRIVTFKDKLMRFPRATTMASRSGSPPMDRSSRRSKKVGLETKTTGRRTRSCSTTA